MTDDEAIDVVLDLALANVVPEQVDAETYNRQMQAMSIVEKLLDQHR